jgi:hypothetical protein
MGRKRGTLKRKTREQRKRPRQGAESHADEAHWLTLAVYERQCDSCGRKGSIAYRHSDQSSLCELCLERLGIEPLESRGWRAAPRRGVRPGCGLAPNDRNWSYRRSRSLRMLLEILAAPGSMR